MTRALELEVGKKYRLSDWFVDYEVLGSVVFESERLTANFGKQGALIKIGDDKYVVSQDETGRFVVLAHYNPETMKKAEVFLGN